MKAHNITSLAAFCEEIKLCSPLRDDEALPVRTHRVVTQVTEEEKPSKKSKKKGKEKKKSKVRATLWKER